MTIEKAIELYEESEKINKELAKNCVSAMAKNHNLENAEKCRQMIEWLRELQERRKQPEIVRCGECVNFVERDFCKVAGHNVHRKSNCMKVFGAERRTDG